ncbi:hypothetical protein FACS1894154_01890 [Betaproteobacteria bacterium]|nr:hypothetical protein FACS1894154_01890 [Betaproteobacteria bacterium]GHU22324.1 hypothetical protein FACS189488_02650 [Betaproteobacteria bacterium]GHU29142.1 hypothetical protein FACS189497_06450 [Betaproteobacteria bacterium]
MASISAYGELIYLHCWEHGLPLEGGLAFESLLRSSRLDYSLASLARIDAVLDVLYKRQKINPDTFLDTQENQNFLFLLAFYTGEIISRSGGSPVVWRSFEEIAAIDPSCAALGKGFDNCLICCIPPEHGSELALFTPLYALRSRLLEGSAAGKSLAFSTALALGPGKDKFPHDQPLPPLPPHSLVDLRARLAECTPAERKLMSMERPAWVTPGHGLAPLFDHGDDLLSAGRVVWGAVVQANSSLFESDLLFSAPGEVVYDPQGRLPRAGSGAIASKLFAYKGQTFADDPALTRYAAHLANEHSIISGEDLSPRVMPYPLKLASTFFEQRGMPDGKLSQHTFPLLINDAYPGLVRMLPLRLWPESLRAEWLENSFTPQLASRAYEQGLQFYNRGNYQVARKWWERAVPSFIALDDKTWVGAPAESLFALNGLGDLYMNGKGVPQDINRAERYWHFAATRGLAIAQCNLGRLYLQDYPAHAADLQQAERWLRQADNRGDEDARVLLQQYGLERKRQPPPQRKGFLGKLFGRDE